MGNYYAIETIGCGRNKRYAIKQVVSRGTLPVNGRVYKTEQKARAAADEMGIRIERCGDIWEII